MSDLDRLTVEHRVIKIKTIHTCLSLVGTIVIERLRAVSLEFGAILAIQDIGGSVELD
jgi:hypothetical protein